MPDIYRLTAPDGQDVFIRSDTEPTDAQKLEAIRAHGDEQAAAAQAKAEAGSTLGSALKPLAQSALATLPMVGGVLGGMAGTGGMPIVGTAVGVGTGAMAGEAARQIANHYLFGDKMNPYAPVGEGLVAGVGGAAMEAAPAAFSALSPSKLLGDVERTGTISPGRIGAEVLKRFAGSLRMAPTPILKRPLWQAAEGQTVDMPVEWPEAHGTLTSTTPTQPQSVSWGQYGVRPSAGEAATEAPAAQGGLSAAEQADLARRYGRMSPLSQETIAKIDAQMAGQTPAPIRGQLRQIQPAVSHGPTVAPPDMESQGLRFNQGSQVQARMQGTSRATAQANTDSVQGTRNETSLVMPWEKQQELMAKMDRLIAEDPSGQSLVTFIDAAKDDITKRALVNWERMNAYKSGRQPFYALAGAAATAPLLRGQMRMMASHDQQ